MIIFCTHFFAETSKERTIFVCPQWQALVCLAGEDLYAIDPVLDLDVDFNFDVDLIDLDLNLNNDGHNNHHYQEDDGVHDGGDYEEEGDRDDSGDHHGDHDDRADYDREG